MLNAFFWAFLCVWFLFLFCREAGNLIWGSDGVHTQVINMLVDADKRIVGFALDGKLQGACQIPGKEPLYVMTHMDTPRDHVELKKPLLEDAPKDVLASLTGALIDIEKGEKLGYY